MLLCIFRWETGEPGPAPVVRQGDGGVLRSRLLELRRKLKRKKELQVVLALEDEEEDRP